MPTRHLPAGLVVGAANALLAIVLTWPLALHLRTGLLGAPSGDTGVYVWNIWIFRHELLEHSRLPFFTDHLFALTGGADFALHNYAPAASLFGATLVGPLGLVGAFNVTMLAMIAASATATYALARRLGLAALPAWLAGALFAASPVLSAKETAHFSLVIAAPLPLFLWALLRALDTLRWRDALFVGVVAALAGYSDAYYSIYCFLMGAFLVSWRFLRLESRRTFERSRGVGVADGAIAVLALLVALRVVTGVERLQIAGLVIGLKTLYTPVLALTAAVLARAWYQWRPRLRVADDERRLQRLVWKGAAAVGVCLLMMSPVLAGILDRWSAGRLPQTEIYWRSSPPGLDLLAYLVPNPVHAWFGDVTRPWLLPERGDAFPEFVGSFSLTAFAVLAVAWWRHGLSRFWLAFTGFFAAMSLGPFVHVGGMNTYLVGPWALLRYVPLVGMARSPSRFAIVVALGLSILVATAVQQWLRAGSRVRPALWAAALVMAFELIPAPRPLFSAAIPDVYRRIATADDESGRLLELPTGIRDGTSSLGNFNPASEFFQTLHHRPLVGGYLSRVSRWRRMEQENRPMLRAIFALSQGETLTPEQEAAARAARESFLAQSCVRYVVVDRHAASGALQTFARATLRLTPIYEDADYALLEPDAPPPCRHRDEASSRLASVAWR